MTPTRPQVRPPKARPTSNASRGNDRLFVKLPRTLGHPEWAEDARFGDDRARVADRAALTPGAHRRSGRVSFKQPNALWKGGTLAPKNLMEAKEVYCPTSNLSR
jgi:crotonobetainyl-CoA:carnitine CoA-transferase CaiB-like acyl-CoA transferase